MPTRVQQLLTLGQSVWLDFIRRGHLLSGGFDRDVNEAGVVGVTSNPTIFQQAIGNSGDYDASLAEGIARGLEGEPLFESLALEDIRMACDRLRSVFDASRGLDGRVSLEVSPRLARDTAGSLAAAKRLHAAAARANVMIKIPATPEGLPAITGTLAAGISVNVTLIFSVARYRRPVRRALGRVVLRLARGQQGGRCDRTTAGDAARGRHRARRAREPARQGRGCERAPGVRDVRGDRCRAALPGAPGAGRARAAAALGFHQHEESGLSRRALR